MHVVNEIWLARDREHKGPNIASIYLDKFIQFGSQATHGFNLHYDNALVIVVVAVCLNVYR